MSVGIYKDGVTLILFRTSQNFHLLTMTDENFSRKELGKSLSESLCSIDFQMPLHGYDFSLEEAVMDHFRAQPWAEAHVEKAVKMAKGISTDVGFCYPFANKDIQAAYGIRGAYTLLVDDMTKELGPALDHCAMNLVLRRPQESPILQSLANWLGQSPAHQGAFVADTNIKSTIDHISGCIIERDYGSNMMVSRGALNFPPYLRTKTGSAELSAHFCFPETLYPESKFLHVYLPAIQDLYDYINHTNDILSFYKESILGQERLTYIPNFAQAHDLTLTKTFRKIIANVTENVQNIGTVFAESPQLLKTTEEFIQGYGVWYLEQLRYRLGELTIRIADGKRYQPITAIARRVCM